VTALNENLLETNAQNASKKSCSKLESRCEDSGGKNIFLEGNVKYLRKRIDFKVQRTHFFKDAISSFP